MGKKGVIIILTILLITGITVCCLGRNTVSTGMHMKSLESSNEISSRPNDIGSEEVGNIEPEAVRKTEASVITNEKASLNAKTEKTSMPKSESVKEESDKGLGADGQNKDRTKAKKSESDEKPKKTVKSEQQTETVGEHRAEQRTEAAVRESTEQRTEMRTEGRTEQPAEEHKEEHTEQPTEQRTEASVEQTTKKPAEQRTEQKTEAPQCAHNWVWKTHTEIIHHDDVYEEYLICEAYDENIYESHSFCNNCDLDLTANFGGASSSEAADHMLNVCGGCGYHSGRAVVGTVHHDAEYGTKCTALAYDEEVEVKDYEYCSICGTKK